LPVEPLGTWEGPSTGVLDAPLERVTLFDAEAVQPPPVVTVTL
jgi:hypothetical protein